MTDGLVNYDNGGCALSLPPMEETMGKRIARLREAKGMTQAEMARRLGLSRASIHQWETDASPNIRPANLLALADLLGTDPHYLVHGPDRVPPGRSDSTAATGRFRALHRKRG